MEEKIISLETAVLLKDVAPKSFDIWNDGLKWYQSPFSEFGEQIFDSYMNNESITAPTQSLLQKWLREEHSLFVSVTTYTNECNRVNLIIDNHIKYAFEYKTYEEALEKGLKVALKLI
jgi:hypothetical protein